MSTQNLKFESRNFREKSRRLLDEVAYTDDTIHFGTKMSLAHRIGEARYALDRLSRALEHTEHTREGL